MSNIPVIAVTGGPSGGKSTFMAKAAERCVENGFQPLIVPEAATIFINGGMDPTSSVFQENVMRFVLHMEASFLREAHTLPKPVVLTDRGLLDQNGVYMPHHDFLELGESVTHLGRNEFFVEARDKRYAGVICLRTAPREYYTTANNEARRETYEEAVALDERTMHAWVGAPHLRVIENKPGQSFDHKINAALAELTRILGVPEPYEIEKRYLVHQFRRELLPEHTVAIDIVQTYLIGQNEGNERVRARGQNDHYIYFHTVKVPVPNGEGVIERERILSRREYETMLVRRDLSCQQIHKTRYCFVHAGQYCELDVFHGHLEGLVMLEVEVPSLDTQVDVPPFIGEHINITGAREYSNYALARRTAQVA